MFKYASENDDAKVCREGFHVVLDRQKTETKFHVYRKTFCRCVKIVLYENDDSYWVSYTCNHKIEHVLVVVMYVMMVF